MVINSFFDTDGDSPQQKIPQNGNHQVKDTRFPS